jgi:hypothetical protein
MRQPSLVAGSEDYGGAHFCQPIGNGFPDTAGCPRDYCDLIA